MQELTSLILLSVLTGPPIVLAAMEAIVSLRLLTKAEPTTGQNESIKIQNRGAIPTGKVYDGSITIEIPIAGPQVVAYESLLPPGEDPGIELIESR